MALAPPARRRLPPGARFLYVDGHARAYYGTRTVQKMHIARQKFPAPATEETWVTGQHGDPVFMVFAEPLDSLADELRRLLPQLRQVAGEGRRVTDAGVRSSRDGARGACVDGAPTGEGAQVDGDAGVVAAVLNRVRVVIAARLHPATSAAMKRPASGAFLNWLPLVPMVT
jgi:hypothetical protein